MNEARAQREMALHDVERVGAQVTAKQSHKAAAIATVVATPGEL